jgi:hypothetical protein
MSSGFNTDVRVGDQVFHVQTEDRGAAYKAIDTAVYQNGRVLLRRSISYRSPDSPAAFSEDELRQKVENQHRTVIDELRSGALDAELAAAAERAGRPSGVEVQLLNPGSWLSGGHVTLDIKVSRRADNNPEAAAEVEAIIEGALEDVRHSGKCDDAGRTRIQFPLPPLGKGDLVLVIQARSEAGQGELRFTMRSRAKAPSAGGTP